jgi:hypothetical protein
MKSEQSRKSSSTSKNMRFGGGQVSSKEQLEGGAASNSKASLEASKRTLGRRSRFEHKSKSSLSNKSEDARSKSRASQKAKTVKLNDKFDHT